jgi:ectoine hydroxylase-related dioxygenase (phytanoyl-CoA dioxygenase family)
MLTDAQIAQYHDRGFVIPDFRLSEETLARIRADHDRLLERNPQFRDYCSSVLAFDVGFLEYARTPEIVEMVAQLIGPDVALWNMSFFAKPARNGRKVPWHQDGEYWPVRPLATCSVWLAVDDARPDNGCLRFMPGSHKARRLAPHTTNDSPDLALNQEIDRTEYDDAKAVDLVLEAGQMSLHDVYLVHGSNANTSEHPRRGMTMRFMPTTSVFDRVVAKQIHERIGITDHSLRTVFLMRGVDRSGKNDFVVRR